jgi:hypothetical protein
MTSFTVQGGSILWNAKVPLTEEDLIHFHGLFRDEADAAWKAGDLTFYTKCAELVAEVVHARDAFKRWAKASGGAA